MINHTKPLNVPIAPPYGKPQLMHKMTTPFNGCFVIDYYIKDGH